MAEHRLMRRVDAVVERLQRLQRLQRRSRLFLWLALAGLILLVANWLLPQPVLSPLFALGLGFALLVATILLTARLRSNISDAALLVEQRYPDLDSRLLTAVGQRPNYEAGGFSFLQHEVISESLLHAQRHDWNEAVPARKLASARLMQSLALLLFVLAFGGAALVARRPPDSSGADLMVDNRLHAEGDVYRVSVEPGNVELERGTPLLVLARFDGKLPETVTLFANKADGERQEQPLSRSLEDPLFGGRLPAVDQDLTYFVRFEDQQSERFRVRVFDYPRLERADATITYPEYTSMATKTIEDVRRVSVVEGSQLTLTCTLNKPVDRARLLDEENTEFQLQPDPQQKQVYSASWIPDKRRTFTLELVDDAGRHNKQPPKFVIDVIPNEPPDLKVAFPARDMRVSPLQELPLEALVRDDFGLKQFGLIYQLPDGREQVLELGDTADPDAQIRIAHELSFEEFGAQPNELVSYYFFADDVGPAGQPRRAMSNMYFAEVRHFDEIFRQAPPGATGSPSQSEQSEQGTPSAQLLKLQREIVTANWNLIRREHGSPTEMLTEDATVVADSQSEALKLALELQQSIEDVVSRQHVADAIDQMQQAEEQLRTAAQASDVAPLREARRFTQGAYSALLKLQARENLVRRNENSQSASSSSGQQQRLNEQLNELELKNDRNRYETEQQDSQPSNREATQILNRLRELARRQGDLNEKIQELENALRTAETEEERNEIERQLKRLQEEQQQLLRDLDETKERMERPENRSDMAEARNQVEQTREHLRQSSQSLQQGQLSKALSEGKRAERELENLKDEFRDETAGQFAENMRQLRDEVRELAEREQQLAEQLTDNESAREEADGQRRRPQLRDERPQEENLENEFAEQEEKLGDLMKSVEDIVRESELSEPLLSKKLYDAVRKTRVDQPEESLAMTSQFLKYGLKREAAAAEQQARRGIDTLREGVEEAAESVLGNEASSLERARREVDELARSIAEEMAQNDSQFAESRERHAEDGQGGQEESEQQQANRGRGGNPEGQPAPEGSSQASQMPPSDREGQRPQGLGSGRPESQSQQSENSGQPQQQSESSSANGSPPPQGDSSQEGQPQRGGQPGRQDTAQSSTSQQRSPSQGRGRNASDQDNPLSAFLQQSADDGGTSGPHLGPARPLTSSDFVEWSDRMRDVEEMLEDPELRAEVARIRDQAREMRIEVKRHSKEPDWELVRLQVYGPMLELQNRLAEELARLQRDRDQFVPLDRDPVPDRYAELVRQYYERLGSGR